MSHCVSRHRHCKKDKCSPCTGVEDIVSSVMKAVGVCPDQTGPLFAAHPPEITGIYHVTDLKVFPGLDDSSNPVCADLMSDLEVVINRPLQFCNAGANVVVRSKTTEDVLYDQKAVWNYDPDHGWQLAVSLVPSEGKVGFGQIKLAYKKKCGQTVGRPSLYWVLNVSNGDFTNGLSARLVYNSALPPQ